MLKITPYIYSFILFSFSVSVFSQNNRVLELIGSNNTETSILKNLNTPQHKIPDSLIQLKLKSIQKQLFLLGYTNHKISNTSYNDSIALVTYQLGTPQKQLIIHTPKSTELSKVLGYTLNAKGGLEVPFRQIGPFLDSLVQLYQSKGFPFVNVQLIKLQKNKEVLEALLKIDSLQKRHIDRIIIKGYKEFPSSYLTHYFALKKGDLFEKKKIDQLSNTVKSLDFTTEIKAPEILFKKDSTDLYLYLKKTKNNYFNGLLGVATGQNNKLYLNGFLNLKLRNTLNYGERFELNWLSDGKQSQNLNVQIETPYLFKSPISTNYSLNIYKKDSSFIKLSLKFSLDYPLKKQQKIGFIYSKNQSNQIKDVVNQSDYSGNFYGIYYRYKKPNNHPVFKTKFELYNSVEQGNRNEEKQHIISNYLKVYIPINTKKSLTIQNTSKLLFSKNYIDNELFRIGGNHSIRGFDEASIITDKYTYVSIDYNYLINDESFVTLLSDFAITENKMNPNKITSYYTFGLGYTTKTPLGFLGIQYAIGNDSTNSFSFTNSKLHIRFSQVF